MRAQHPADHLGVADDKVRPAVVEPGLGEEMPQGDRRQRRRRGGLGDDRAPRRQGGRELLGHHRQREVPRRDDARHAGRAVVHRPLAPAHVARQHARFQRREVLRVILKEPGRVFDLADGFLQGLAVFQHDDPGQFLLVG
jgi:hypothetical protein